MLIIPDLSPSPSLIPLTAPSGAGSDGTDGRMVLQHPLNQRLALYGMNGGTCKVLPREARQRERERQRERAILVQRVSFQGGVSSVRD